MEEKAKVIFGTVSWSGCVGGRPTVVTAYKNGASVWSFKRRWICGGQWMRARYKTLAEALAVTELTQKTSPKTQ